jgi:hypothetical protein
MRNALDLLKAAQFPVQEILQGDPADDVEALLRVFDEIVDGVRAGRRNQAEFPMHAARALELIDAYSVKAPPRLRS